MTLELGKGFLRRNKPAKVAKKTVEIQVKTWTSISQAVQWSTIHVVGTSGEP